MMPPVDVQWWIELGWVREEVELGAGTKSAPLRAL